MHDATITKFGLLAGLVGSLIGGCGDIAADPIVTFGGSPAVSGGLGGGGGTTSGGSSGGATGSGGRFTAPTVKGLCDPCEDNLSCGDFDDYCVRINLGEGDPLTGKTFCARDCEENFGCPEGYGCNQTSRGIPQCAPHIGACAHRDEIPLPPSLEVMREAVLAGLNDLRDQLGLAALTEDAALDQVAEESAVELAQGGKRFSKFERECRLTPADCPAGWAAEQQIQLAAYQLVWSGALRTALAQAGSTPGTTGNGNVELSSPTYKKVGIGVLMAGDEAFFSFTYAP